VSNTILTPTAVTREILRVLHQKLNFIGTIDRQYDDSFAKSGAKIGDTLKIRLPNQYVVRTGAVLDVQDTTEDSVELKVQTLKGVDMKFTDVDLTMSLDDFSKRIIEPATSVLAANIEADAMSMYKDVYNQATQATITSALTQATVLAGRKKLNDFLAPTSGRIGNLTTQQNVDLVSDAKNLFHDSAAIKEQYREGSLGRFAGFDWYENSIWGRHTAGTATVTAYDVDGASESGSSITIKTGSGTLVKGDIVTFAGCYAVHHETKTNLGYLKQFVVTETATGTGELKISPAIVLTGAKQNVSALPTDSGDVTKVGGNAVTMDVGLLYHPTAFTFATADLQMPKGVDFAAREMQDGLSIRLVRDYDINNNAFPCRLDILYGYKTLRPESACRLASTASA